MKQTTIQQIEQEITQEYSLSGWSDDLKGLFNYLSKLYRESRKEYYKEHWKKAIRKYRDKQKKCNIYYTKKSNIYDKSPKDSNIYYNKTLSNMEDIF